MRRLVLSLTIIMGLIAPASASAITAAQARQAVSKKLTQVYGVAWRHHSPSWSVPECRAPQRPQQFTCPTEFEHGGTWHSVYPTVVGHKVKLYRRPIAHWTRRWRTSKPGCSGSATIRFVGELSSNDGTCHELTLVQNFGADDDGKVRYTGFKPSVMIYGTLTAVWPDFYLFKCRSSAGIYQCTNRFGDGFRWKPAAAAGTPPPTTEFYADVPGGRIACGIGGPAQFLCMGFPVARGQQMQVATLGPDGSVTSCAQSFDDPECFS